MTYWSVISPVQGKFYLNGPSIHIIRKSYDFETGIWLEHIDNEIQEVSKSKWLERGSIFNDPVPQINNWIVASIHENNEIYFFGVDEAGKEFTAWCQESFSTIVILPKAPKSILK